MVKYRLIKQYPGSPKLGTIVVDTNINNGAKDAYFSENWGKPNSGTAFFIGKNHDCENQPEFWEKVEDKDYEILSYEDNFGNVFSKKGDLFTNDKLTYGPQYCLEYFKIYSIKRLSDGEIFSFGDKLVVNSYMAGRKYITIDSIYYNEHKQLSFRTNVTPPPCTFVFGLSDINCKRYKEPLFITEDGKEITEGDKYWYVVVHDRGIISFAWEPMLHICDWSNPFKPPLGKFQFSTKEAAERWVDENKPKYSKKQINHSINELFSPELSRDGSVFGDALKEGYRTAFFKYLENEQT